MVLCYRDHGFLPPPKPPHELRLSVLSLTPIIPRRTSGAGGSALCLCYRPHIRTPTDFIHRRVPRLRSVRWTTLRGAGSTHRRTQSQMTLCIFPWTPTQSNRLPRWTTGDGRPRAPSIPNLWSSLSLPQSCQRPSTPRLHIWCTMDLLRRRTMCGSLNDNMR